ncbi:MAG TPA: 3D domain-containing protein [Blastocatellia bacterium]|nr:3D domain-containing protein [Blastocatellia bacterium]
MNPKPGVRFTKGLSSGLSIFLMLGVAYSLEGSIHTAIASDGPAGKRADASQGETPIPGVFKNLPDNKDTITAKRLTNHTVVIPAKTLPPAQVAVDANKGVVNKPSGDAHSQDAMDFHATAYCLQGRTATGEYVRPGVIAADPRVLPLGTVVHIRAGKYTGTYKVTDTGGKIKGRKVDIYVPTYKEAIKFGRQRVKVKVLTPAQRRATPGLKK